MQTALLLKERGALQFDLAFLWMMMESCIFIQALPFREILLLDGSKPTEHGAMCFELDPADMLTVKMGPKYIGIASEKEAPGSSYEDIPSWRQAPCVNSMEPITSSTVP